MRRSETVCPRCHQVNVRYSGWASWILNPRWSEDCALCGANLSTGRRTLVDSAAGVILRAGVYLGHAVVGVGIFAVGSMILWPELLDQPAWVRVVPVALGATVGIGLAEWARRKGPR